MIKKILNILLVFVMWLSGLFFFGLVFITFTNYHKGREYVYTKNDIIVGFIFVGVFLFVLMIYETFILNKKNGK